MRSFGIEAAAGAEPDGRPETRGAPFELYSRLKDDILRLRLDPGARLVVDELAQRYGTSATPVRQALHILQVDGLVEIAHNRGARVSPLSAAELELIQSIRTGLEGRLARLGTPKMTDDDVRELRGDLAELKEFRDADNSEDFATISWRLRDRVYIAAERPRLHETAVEWRRRLERYVVSLTLQEDLQRHYRALTSLVAACQSRDGEAAAKATVESAEWTLVALTAELERRRRFAYG